MASSPTTERRASRRTSTARRALLHGGRTKGAIAEGTVVDMSSTGFRMVTGTPMFPGATLEMEIYAGDQVDGATPDTLYVRVVRVVPEGAGQFSVGCTYADYAPEKGAAPVISPPRPTVGSRVRVFDEGNRPPRSKRRGIDRRWLAALLLLLLLLITGAVVAVTAALMSQITDGPTNPVDVILEEQQRIDEVPGVDGAIASMEPTEPPMDSVAFNEFPVTGDELERGMAALYEGDFATAREAFARAQADVKAPPGARAQAGVGLALAYAAMGDRDGGTRALSGVLAMDEAEAPEWWEAGQRVGTLLGMDDPRGLASLMFAAGFELAPVRPGMTANSAARLVVDRNGYTLTLVSDDGPVATYPVGIGMGGATPTGEFVIANKIAFPTWYNRGNPIAPGDPDNPLGDSWMGLGDEQGPTPVGIHPTKEPESIGAQKSAGCIRMRPGDAAALFARCEVGTPVTIR